MKRIVIIGNSAAGVSAAQSIRERDKESKLTIVSAEPFFAYQKHKLLDLLEGKIKERDLYYRSQDFYQNNAIDLLLEKEVVELNLNKKKAVFKDKDFIEFDDLIIASGARVRLPSIKGIQKEGVVAVNGLKDVKFLIENLSLAHTVIVAGSGPVAQSIARIIASKKIEVKFSGNLSEPIEGVEVIPDNPITEILGDSDAKAVRLLTNKVIGVSLIVFSSPRQPCVDFLRGTPIKLNQGVLVDESLRTNVPFIYAAGDVCEFADKEKSYNWETGLKEGQAVAASL